MTTLLETPETIMPRPAATRRDPARAAATLADPRWAVVRARDAAADGSFVYAVATTDVYCRPSCGARQPRPENVSFHDTPAAARAAGFRACLRCRPDEPPLASRRAALVAEICRHIDASDGAPRLDELAAAAGVSPHHLHRTFKEVTGLTPRQYAVGARQARVRDALGGASSVTEALHEAGYGSSGRFYAESTGALGMAPSRYRRGAPDETIRFGVAPCSLGYVLAARAERGLCAILLGDDPAPLAAELARRFPRAALVAADEALARDLGAVVAAVEAPGRTAQLPLDLRGTAFQRRVWTALAAIPCGTTTTYGALAAVIGAPDAVRAVAGACAANHLAVLIPCHRVVRGDGDLSGYRWGVERKRALLEREGAPAPRPRRSR